MNKETLTKLLTYVEQLYAERGAYRAIAQLNPRCKQLFEQAMSDPQYRAETTQAFSDLSKRLNDHQQLVTLLGNLAQNQKPN